MVNVGGVDVPLIEIIFVLSLIIIIILVESIIIILLLIRQMSQTRKVGESVERLSEAILQVKKAEIEQLDKLTKK